MPLDRLIDKEPRQFAYFHRLMGYSILSLILVIYTFTSSTANYQLYILPLLLIYFLLCPRLEKWLQYKYDKQTEKNVFFANEAIIVAIILAALHLSLVPTFVILFALLYVGLNNKISLMVSCLIGLIGVITFYFSTFFIFGAEQYFEPTNPELTVVSLLGLMVFIVIGNYYQHRRLNILGQQRQHYHNQMTRYIAFANQLSRYAPLQLWQSIMRGEAEAKIEYKRKKLTIFFSDIQGFTELSETLIPDDLAFLLNDYLSHMTEIAKQYEATVDKFMGDAILIFFGDPNSQGSEQDAKSCVEMAIAMRQQMKLLRERWKKMGYPALHIRMGISTGYCHVGNYGASHRMAYTIVGRDVNLAARLQSAAEVDEILIADDTHQLIKNEFLCVPKVPIYLKGIQGPVKTWQVMEKFTGKKSDTQKWFDYDYKGFHLVLNLEEVQNYEYPELVEILEMMIDRIKTQQKITNAQGVPRLSLDDEIKP
ncbi:adenylate/guanylate cyclase domain-containing protein [Acinetobacter haemolyticus]|uniref:adenylate/guanylate cyclase domain-containing protein n=1 Tax=Acinetobacter haemolyticus TaxID=29430 RepID=UPI000E5877E6|nr:adenylate/guanylate cyclase domain-containing protein [Acinetobacter haemolyticus]NAR57142.1 adenylate/guanylate cyclase domain-containing protein [Acinetobacter haemolyticus]NAR78343.1 adenylate/guanylate cyclase domain-containing protein [Acinetobacter haemolyticus]NAR88698.1 adenylate/guanylate cyclase domain-containing protein [Acinetobacter haemolyticus]NAR94778.1 adenylate/guanylate cyclase domain-containing protein [Acinetobacter haemolyticus]QDJ92089.1 adenylate/guanylate cyclase do